MKNFIIVTLINICALFIVSGILGGMIISSWQALIISAILLSLINIYQLHGSNHIVVVEIFCIVVMFPYFVLQLQ